MRYSTRRFNRLRRCAWACLLGLLCCGVVPQAMAWQYLSGYSAGSRSYNLWDGSSARYTSAPSTVYGNSYFVDRIPYAVRQAQARARAARAARLRWYDKNPPCGVYGRVPRRCKKMESHFE